MIIFPRRYLGGLMLLLLPVSTVCAEGLGRPAVQATEVSIGPSIGGMIQLTFGLLFVIGLIFAFAWAMRRYMRLQNSVSGGLQIIGGLSLGVRERLILVQVGEQQILLGVTPTSISTLHVLAQPVNVDVAPSFEAPFAERLNAILQRLKTQKGN